jgi:YVTN family beta-propeller protein
VFVTSYAGLTVIDSLTNSIITNIVTGAKPVGIAVDEANSRVYVANQMSGQIAVLDAATYLVLAKWQPVRSNVWGLALDTGSHRLYVTVPPPAFGGFNGLEVLNSDTGAFLAEIPTGGITISERTAGLVAVDTRLHYAYMTEPDNNLVYVVQDTNLVATVTVGNSPHGLAVDEAKGLLFVGNALDGTISKIDAAALAPFMITQLARQGAQVIVSWNTQAGATYQLQSKASLSDVAWNTLGLLKTANASSMSATDSFNAASPAFYRVARAGN